ncbi:efflux RND transporter periplasmic adaptor subunit [Vibrio sp. JC009]|uniref:HlyD family secretion protein n=1 Tax=Vibrio sp. JC009 TaxID=2912314 RepID=UPI0023B0681E|nr:efflux RND transporter periplasmic adaptor subunit [Vibrio sp. JC009]WED23211.1 efflux RND transporter periplasmic adaptor subunit [Vibrio sp. JC009]
MSAVKTSLFAIAGIGIISWVGYSYVEAYQPQPVRLQGQIEAQQYSISSKVAGRIDQVLVKKGDAISKGDLVFTIYSPELEAKLDQAIAGKEAASALAEEAENGARPQQIRAAKDQWQTAHAATQLAEKTYKRVNALFKDGVVAEQRRDEALTQWQAAKHTESAAYQMYEMAKEGARSEKVKAAEQRVKAAAGTVAEVEAIAEDSRITSWFDGEVSQVLLNGGELAPQGFPVVTVVDLDDSWAVFNVREDHLKHFQKGQEFQAFVPALDKDITFKVSHISVMGNFATWRSTDATQGFDLRTFEVEARPVNNNDVLRVGMSVSLEL